MCGLGKNCLNCPVLQNAHESLTDYVERGFFLFWETAQTSMQLFFCAPGIILLQTWLQLDTEHAILGHGGRK